MNGSMTRQAFYVKWGVPASFEMRDDLIAALASVGSRGPWDLPHRLDWTAAPPPPPAPRGPGWWRRWWARLRRPRGADGARRRRPR